RRGLRSPTTSQRTPSPLLRLAGGCLLFGESAAWESGGRDQRVRDSSWLGSLRRPQRLLRNLSRPGGYVDGDKNLECRPPARVRDVWGSPGAVSWRLPRHRCRDGNPVRYLDRQSRCRPRDRSARDPRWVRRAPVPGNTHFSRHLRQCWWCEPEHLRRGIIDSLTFGPATRCGNPAGMKFAVSFLGCSGDVIPDLTQWASRGSSAGTNKPSFFHQELSSSPNQSVGYGTTAFGCAVFVHKVSHSRFRNAARWLAEI